MLNQIRQEISGDKFYQQNFANNGQRFVAWYLRRIVLCDASATRQAITDGANDKQIDAVLVDDENQRILIIQGKFIGEHRVDSGPVREVLAAWMGLQNLASLQDNANDRLRERLEAVGRALEDDYDVEFELLTTGELTDAARADVAAYEEQIGNIGKFGASLHLVDSDVMQARLSEAEGKELPELTHIVHLDPDRTMAMEIRGTRAVIAALPLKECLRFPGITDGRLFRKNVRQFLGTTNKVNQGLRQTIRGERARDFFFYHNGITALSRQFELSADRTELRLRDVSVVNGCQSLATLYHTSERIKEMPDDEAFVLFRFYEIPQRDLADRISTYTNSQTAVKPRDLRSNDSTMLAIKRAFETMYPDGYLTVQRGAQRPPDKDAEKTVDVLDLAKALMAWQCQRPYDVHSERRLFDEYYKTLFRPGYDPASILALQVWLNAIEQAWASLQLEDVLRAGRSYSRFHVLYAVSALIANASGQGDKAAKPAATLQLAQNNALEILPLAVNCINNALTQSVQDAQLSGRVFSPQNWAKSRASAQAEALVAGTIVGMLAGIGAADVGNRMRIPPEEFEIRWSAD